MSNDVIMHMTKYGQGLAKFHFSSSNVPIWTNIFAA